MNVALALAAAAMGVAATPHCLAMCGAPCAALTRGGRGDAWTFHLGRVAGYAVGGAVAATSVALLGTWTRELPALRPLWLLLHLAFLALGLWWLLTGATPRVLVRDTPATIHVVRHGGRPLRAGLAGLAWVAWPCGALQGALLVAALADGPVGGAVVMGSFALCTLPALGAAPWLWRRAQALGGGQIGTEQFRAAGYRMAGLALVASSTWAMASGLRERLGAFCAT